MNVSSQVLCAILSLIVFNTSAQWNSLSNPSRIYYSGGNVGIGTDKPDYPLSIYKSAGATLGIVTEQSTSDAGLWFRINSVFADAAIIYRGDGRLSFNLDNGGSWVESNECMTILGTGGIGMGKIAPSSLSRLHVKSTQINGHGLIVEANDNGRFVSVGHDGSTGILSSGFLDNSSFSGLQFNKGNIARMKIEADGKVGIGTTDLTENIKLAIATPDWHIGMNNTDPGGANWRIGSTSNNWAAGGGKFIISNHNASYNASLVIDQLKNVGIGTISPVDRLHVVGSVVLDTSSPTLFTSSSPSDQNRFLHLRNSPSLTAVSGLKAGGILVADSYDYGAPGKNDMIVKGKVGIGTTLSSNPNNYSLFVNGTVNASAMYVNDELVRSSQWVNSNGAIHYGNSVGIGTSLATNPNSYKLAVNGKIGAHEVRVEQSSITWPDYVFAQGYELPSLNDIDKYI